MASRAWRALGRGSVLGTLRADVKRATREVLLVGPWIDDHVAAAVVEACAPAVALRVLTRPIESSSPGFASLAAAAAARFAGRAQDEAIVGLPAERNFQETVCPDRHGPR